MFGKVGEFVVSKQKGGFYMITGKKDDNVILCPVDYDEKTKVHVMPLETRTFALREPNKVIDSNRQAIILSPKDTHDFLPFDESTLWIPWSWSIYNPFSRMNVYQHI